MLLRPPNGFHRDIIAIGGSAGALEAICDILAQLPCRLPVSILVVMHRPVSQPSDLPEIIAGKSGWHVVVANEGERLRKGICIVSPPDRHLVMGPNQRIHLLRNGFYRTHNIDALFCSLAYHAGSRVIGMILSGMLKDGTLGLKANKEAGCAAFVQSPMEAEYPEMPRNALNYDGPVDFVGPSRVLGQELYQLFTDLPRLHGAAR